MPLDFSGLIQGLTGDVRGILSGMEQKKEYERQARMQLLQEQLLKAQTQRALREPLNKSTAPHYFVNDQGQVTVATPQDPTVAVPVQGATGKVTPKRVAKAPTVKPPSVQQQETVFAARNALAALNQADAILAKDPNADVYPTSAATLEKAGSVPVVGGAVRGLLESAGQQQLTPSQQAFQQAMDQFLHNYGSVLPKGGRSASILENLRNSFAPRAGQTSPQIRAAFRASRAALRQQLQALANGTGDVSALPTGESVIDPTGGGTTTVVPPAASPPPIVVPKKPKVNWGRFQ